MNPNERLVAKLRQKQKELGLTDDDTGLQEVAPILAQPLPRQEDVAFYEQMFAEMAQQRLPLLPSDRRELQYFQQSFRLSDEDVYAIEQHVLATLGLEADTDDITNAPPPPAHPFLVSPPGVTTAPQDSYTGTGSTTPTIPNKPPAAGLTPAQKAVMQRVGNVDPASGQQQPAEGQVQLPSIPVTQAPPEAGRAAVQMPPGSPPPPTEAPPATAPAAPETVVQNAPPAKLTAKAEAPPEKVVAVAAEPPETPPATKPKWWLDKRFLIPLFGLLALLTGVAVIFATTRQFWRPSVVDPQAAQQFVEAGTQSLQQRQYQAAIKAFDEAIRLNPTDFKNYINRGYARHRVGDRNGAIADYNQAIELNGNAAEAFNNRSHVHFDQDRLDDAIKDANRALELNPGLPEANVNLGNALFAKGDLDRAAQEFQKALQSSSAASTTKARAHNNRGNIFLARAQIAEAGSEYDQAIQLDPQYADAFFNRGVANERNRNFTAAARDFTEAAKLYQAQGNDGRRREAQSKAERMQQESTSTPLPPASPGNQQEI